MSHASVDTWDVKIAFPQAMLLDRRAVMTPLDGPLIQRRQTMSSTGPNTKNTLRLWKLQLKDLTPDEYTAVVALFDNTGNGCEPMDITFRGFSLVGASSETVQVRLLADSMTFKASSPVRFNVSFEVEEFLHAP